MKAECVYCLDVRALRPRGLCWTCYYTPGVREKHPSTSKYARRGIGNGHNVNAPLPTCATSASPGSEEKIAILAERARQRQSLWHPNDVTIGGTLDALLVGVEN